MAKRLPMKIDAVTTTTTTTITAVALLNNKSIQYRYSLNKGKVIQMAAKEAKMSASSEKFVGSFWYG